jgi:hypothetical protein
MATAYLLICRAPSGEALSMGIYSDREPAVHGSYRWEAAPKPYAEATGDTFAQAERTLVRRLRQRSDPWPADLEALVLDVLDPQRSDFAAYRSPAADARARNIDTIRDAVADVDGWTDARLQRVADAIRSGR